MPRGGPTVFKILLIHGPNLNLLGKREPQIYGTSGLNEIDSRMKILAEQNEVELRVLQSNSEGAIPVTAIWINPQVVGKYDIVVDVNGNGVYDAEVDALDDNDVEVTAGIVIPEFSSILIIPLLVITSVFSILVLKDNKKWQKPLAEKLE